MLPSAIRQETAIKGIWIGKEETKLLLFADDRIVYMENPRESPKKPPRTNEFNEIEGCTVNIKKSVVFLYTSNEHVEAKLKIKYHLQSLQKMISIKVRFFN